MKNTKVNGEKGSFMEMENSYGILERHMKGNIFKAKSRVMVDSSMNQGSNTLEIG